MAGGGPEMLCRPLASYIRANSGRSQAEALVRGLLQQRGEGFVHCFGPQFITLRGGVQAVTHHIQRNCSSGIEEYLADVEIMHFIAVIQLGNDAVDLFDLATHWIDWCAAWEYAE